jgi:hypothetical protein
MHGATAFDPGSLHLANGRLTGGRPHLTRAHVRRKVTTFISLPFDIFSFNLYAPFSFGRR